MKSFNNPNNKKNANIKDILLIVYINKNSAI